MSKKKTPLQLLIFERGLSLDKVAKMSGVSKTTAWYAANGVASEETRVLIANALGVEVEEIFPSERRVRA